jgi:hypothetical protein
MKDFDLLPRTIIPASRFREFLSGTREKTPENGRNTVIIFGGGILPAPARTYNNRKNPAAGYVHQTPACIISSETTTFPQVSGENSRNWGPESLSWLLAFVANKK